MSDAYTVVVEEGFAGEEFEQIMAAPDALVHGPRASQDGRGYDRVPATNKRGNDAQVCLSVIGRRNGSGRDCASRLRGCARASAAGGQ